jgi:hypothetical protein
MAFNVEDYATANALSRKQVLGIVVAEPFIRRAAIVGGPFVLKGSYLTRQYLPDPDSRIPGDLDWVGTGQRDAEELDPWLVDATNISLDDGVRFRCFPENSFWRGIDYAMDDDFPTVNTDLLAWVGDECFELCGRDVSFGLKLDPPPVAIQYRPIQGEPFYVPATCALDLQIAWKLHQTLVRPRFKDLVDLTWLLQHNRVDGRVVMQALQDECRHDDTPIERFNWLLDGGIGKHPCFAQRTALRPAPLAVQQRWSAWLEAGEDRGYAQELLAKFVVRDVRDLPSSIETLLLQLSTLLKESGFGDFASFGDS